MAAVIPGMLDAGKGSIVNNASVSGLSPTRGEAAYSAAKAGVIALTASGALEYGPTIRVNCVAPGFIRTALTAIWDDHPDAFAPIGEAIPLGRIGSAEEVAAVIAFLCSDEAAYVTGHTLVVDGGLSLPRPAPTRRSRACSARCRRETDRVPYCSDMIASNSASGSIDGEPLTSTTTRWRWR